jgi:hypothetical protein
MGGRQMVSDPWVETDFVHGENNPIEAGFYAVTRCWEPEEGFFPGSSYWDGTGWDDDGRAILLRSPSPFETKRDAIDWAYENDWEMK